MMRIMREKFRITSRFTLVAGTLLIISSCFFMFSLDKNDTPSSSFVSTSRRLSSPSLFDDPKTVEPRSSFAFATEITDILAELTKLIEGSNINSKIIEGSNNNNNFEGSESNSNFNNFNFDNYPAPAAPDTYFRIAGWSGLGFYKIEIVHPTPGYKYSVTIESENKYTGTAQLLTGTTGYGRKLFLPSSASVVSASAYHGSSSPSLVYAWKPVVPLEDYHIYVHELEPDHCCFSKSKNKKNKKPTERVVHRQDDISDSVEPLSVSLEQLGGESYLAQLHNLWHNAPSCSSFTNVDSLSSWGGHWIGPGLPYNFGNSLRSGWSLLPSSEMNCKVDSFSRDDLLSIPPKQNGRERSIYVLGMSVTRGVVQSLIDLWLPQLDKRNFIQSIIRKCWGRFEMKKGNLKLTYQHFQVLEMETPDKVGSLESLECHNDLISKEGGGFLQGAYEQWEAMFRDPDDWPDVVFFGTGYRWGNNFDFDSHVLRFAQTLPAEWRGKLIFSDGEYHGGWAGLGSVDAYESYRSEIRGMISAMNDPRVRWLDGMGVAKEKRMHTESTDLYVSGSANFHRRKNPRNVYLPSGQYVKTKRKHDMKICSDITEIVAHMLIGQLLGPRDAFLEQVKEADSYMINEKSELETCTACPKKATPFIIVPYPEKNCYTGPLHSLDPEIDYSPRPPPKECPEYCMRQEPEWEFPSESDESYAVLVRNCIAGAQ